MRHRSVARLQRERTAVESVTRLHCDPFGSPLGREGVRRGHSSGVCGACLGELSGNGRRMSLTVGRHRLSQYLSHSFCRLIPLSSLILQKWQPLQKVRLREIGLLAQGRSGRTWPQSPELLIPVFTCPLSGRAATPALFQKQRVPVFWTRVISGLHSSMMFLPALQWLLAEISTPVFDREATQWTLVALPHPTSHDPNTGSFEVYALTVQTVYFSESDILSHALVSVQM